MILTRYKQTPKFITEKAILKKKKKEQILFTSFYYGKTLLMFNMGDTSTTLNTKMKS